MNWEDWERSHVSPGIRAGGCHTRGLGAGCRLPAADTSGPAHHASPSWELPEAGWADLRAGTLVVGRFHSSPQRPSRAAGHQH